MLAKNFVYKFCRRFFPNCVSSKMLKEALSRQGIKCGKSTVFFDAGNINIDASRPELLSIGDYCKITSGVVILTHDYSRSVLRMVYGDIVGEARKTVIGNNVFIGMRSIILMGTQIGDNSIIGAGSVCHGVYPPNSIIAGNPAKVIMSLDEYYKKRKEKYIDEAKEQFFAFKDLHGRYPDIHDMGAFFPLYLERTREALIKNDLRTNLSGDIEEDVIIKFLDSKPTFETYDEFVAFCTAPQADRRMP